MNTVRIKDVDTKFSSAIVFHNRKVLITAYKRAVVKALLHDVISKELKDVLYTYCTNNFYYNGLQDTCITLVSQLTPS